MTFAPQKVGLATTPDPPRAGCEPEGRRATPPAPRRSQPGRRFGDAPKHGHGARVQARARTASRLGMTSVCPRLTRGLVTRGQTGYRAASA
jgi:hypothetical protein